MLANVVKRLTREAKKQGGTLTPTQISQLEREANLSFDNAFVTVTAPFAPETWQGEVILPTGSLQSGRVDMRFSRPVEIVGIYPALVPVGAVGVDAKMDEIACQIDIDHQNFRTSTITDTTQTSNFVTLNALAVDKRQFGLRIDSPRPSVGFTFRWRTALNTRKDTLISVTLFCRWLRESGA